MTKLKLFVTTLQLYCATHTDLTELKNFIVSLGDRLFSERDPDQEMLVTMVPNLDVLFTCQADQLAVRQTQIQYVAFGDMLLAAVSLTGDVASVLPEMHSWMSVIQLEMIEDALAVERYDVFENTLREQQGDTYLVKYAIEESFLDKDAHHDQIELLVQDVFSKYEETGNFETDALSVEHYAELGLVFDAVPLDKLDLPDVRFAIRHLWRVTETELLTARYFGVGTFDVLAFPDIEARYAQVAAANATERSLVSKCNIAYVIPPAE